MFSYTTEQGFDYAKILLHDYLHSDFFENKEGLTEMTFSIRELNELFRTRSFKEFIIRRENDYSSVSFHVSNISYDYESGFGNILDIGSGKYEAISAFDRFNANSNIILTSYFDPIFFPEDTDVLEGEIKVLKTYVDGTPYNIPAIKHGKFLEERDYSKKRFTLNDFDTIFYLHQTNLDTMEALIDYCVKKNKLLVTGFVSDFFDKTFYDKLANFEEFENDLIMKFKDKIQFENLEDSGCVAKLIHTL